MNLIDTPERRQLRELTRSFVTREIVPHLDGWERAGELPRDLHRATAKVGLLGIGFPEAYGGSGGDLLDMVAVNEEILYAGGFVRADRGAVHPRHLAAAHGAGGPVRRRRGGRADRPVRPPDARR